MNNIISLFFYLAVLSLSLSACSNLQNATTSKSPICKEMRHKRLLGSNVHGSDKVWLNRAEQSRLEQDFNTKCD
jgi:hypothetical protein